MDTVDEHYVFAAASIDVTDESVERLVRALCRMPDVLGYETHVGEEDMHEGREATRLVYVELQFANEETVARGVEALDAVVDRPWCAVDAPGA